MSLLNLANQLTNDGRRDEALARTQEAVDVYRALAKANPGKFTGDLAGALNNLSNQLRELGHLDEALAALQEALALRHVLC